MQKATIVMLLALFLVGCSKTLTRGKARDLIRERYHYDQEINYEFHPSREEVQSGIKAGLWTSSELTPYGKKYFVISSECHCMMTVAKVRPSIEVTGITGDGEFRTVLYTLHWFDDLPSEVKTVFTDSEQEKHSCLMQLYDDGWRVQ